MKVTHPIRGRAKNIIASRVETKVTLGPPRQTQHADFPHYAFLLPSQQRYHKRASQS